MRDIFWCSYQVEENYSCVYVCGDCRYLCFLCDYALCEDCVHTKALVARKPSGQDMRIILKVIILKIWIN